MRRFLRVVGSLAAIYIVLIILMFGFQRSLIYHPDSTVPVPAEWHVPDMSAVRVATEDGLDLLGWWKAPSSAKSPVMLYLHGNAGHLGHRGAKLRPYLDEGWGVLLLAWRGFSGNAGSPSEQGLLIDGHAGLRWLAGQGFSRDRLVLYGESLGTGIAVPLAAEGAGRVLVLEAPYTSLDAVASVHYPFFFAGALVTDRFDSLSRIGEVRLPVLIVHGEDDWVVPTRMGHKLFEAANDPKESAFIAGAGHADLYDHGAAAAVIGFVRRHFAD